jgi:hypothetical protein
MTAEIVQSPRQPAPSPSLYYSLFLGRRFSVRQAGYIVNLSDFDSYRLIGKLTAFLHLQEFSLRKPTVTSSTSAERLSLTSSKAELAWPKAELAWLSLRMQFYVLILT